MFEEVYIVTATFKGWCVSNEWSNVISRSRVVCCLCVGWAGPIAVYGVFSIDNDSIYGLRERFGSAVVIGTA